MKEVMMTIEYESLQGTKIKLLLENNVEDREEALDFLHEVALALGVISPEQGLTIIEPVDSLT